MEEFLEPFLVSLAPSGRSQQQQRNLGSGFIIGSDGSVVTNAHVIENATENYRQTPRQKEEFEAKVLGKDPKTDVALIKIDSSAEFADGGTGGFGAASSGRVGYGGR